MGQTTPEQEAAWAAQKAESLDRHKRCRQWLNTRDRQRITAWLNTLEPAEREKCRATLNRMMEKE
ncbi:hypothetical protein CGX12_11860 [Zobellella denitrificans]|uniref:hypothetical protein n=1 Tax=Zobellella denitrificans TaxID=347534 RepID=UPI000B8BE9A8|nr:hypothetical protein [Zobellella denitrificans]OXS14908.1 hypothetical protein CGX12_11860 [Zobellella denitrificans]